VSVMPFRWEPRFNDWVQIPCRPYPKTPCRGLRPAVKVISPAYPNSWAPSSTTPVLPRGPDSAWSFLTLRFRQAETSSPVIEPGPLATRNRVDLCNAWLSLWSAPGKVVRKNAERLASGPSAAPVSNIRLRKPARKRRLPGWLGGQHVDAGAGARGWPSAFALPLTSPCPRIRALQHRAQPQINWFRGVCAGLGPHDGPWP